MLHTENIGLRDFSGLLQIGSHMFAMVLFTKFMKILSLENFHLYGIHLTAYYHVTRLLYTTIWLKCSNRLIA